MSWKTKLWDAKHLTYISFWRAVVGEALALFLFVFVVCASTLPWYTADMNSSKILIISFTVGFAIATLVHCFGEVSGGHINPAVTLSMLFTANIGVFRAFFYIVAQSLGAIGGAALLLGITPEEVRGTLGVTEVSPLMTPAQGFGMEFMMTFILVFTIFCTVDSKRHVTGSQSLAIGLAIIIDHLIGVSFTGASMNPARTLGPAVVMGKYKDFWVYLAGPFGGAVVAGWLYVLTFGRNIPDPDAKQVEQRAHTNAYEMDHRGHDNQAAVVEMEIGTQTVLDEGSSFEPL